MSAEPGGPAGEAGISPANAILRPSARVVLLDGEGRVLLFRVRQPGRPLAAPFWITPGGGLEDGETWEECALRELREETGLEAIELGPLVWLREHTWPWGGRWIRSVERYYVARTRDTAISNHLRLEYEQAFLAEHHWWTVAEMEATPEILVPRAFARLVAPIIAGEWPSVPVIVGR